MVVWEASQTDIFWTALLKQSRSIDFKDLLCRNKDSNIFNVKMKRIRESLNNDVDKRIVKNIALQQTTSVTMMTTAVDMPIKPKTKIERKFNRYIEIISNGHKKINHDTEVKMWRGYATNKGQTNFLFLHLLKSLTAIIRKKSRRPV